MAEEKKSEYQVIEYPTQTALAIKTPNNETISTLEALADILNKLDIILTKF